MRTHDEESQRSSTARPEGRRDSDSLHSAVAGRAVAQRRPAAIGPEGIQYLQRAAGNQAVVQLMEEQSPVLGVVGKGGGSALDPTTRSQMESAVGADFSSVRIHTGAEAAKSATSVQASAYTVGNDIVFGSGGFDPGSAAGKRTLAHELTHVVQQRSGAVDGTPQSGGISVSDPSDRFERAAESNADKVMASLAAPRPASASEGAGSGHDHPHPTAQRAEEPQA
jgi:hypothetical protein